MITITLWSDQIKDARVKGEIVITPEQAASIRGQLNSAYRTVSCTCGECKTCKARERKRLQRGR